MVFAWIVNGCVVGFLLWASARLLRERRRRTRKPAKDLVISPLSGLAMGAMLLGFQAIVQPEVRHRIVEEQKEESVDDASGAEPPGGRLLHGQLRRIRRGDEMGAVTVRVDSDRISAQAEISAPG